MSDLMTATTLLTNAQRILVFTGAGISTGSGIPDFRGPKGVWTRLDPSDFTLDRYLSDPHVRKRSWERRAGSGMLDALPNDGHRAVTALWNTGRMVGCVTQNIDGLHQEAGLPGDAVVELHGNAAATRCIACGERTATADVLARVEAGEADPACGRCGGILKADVVLFGEMMPREPMDRAFELADRCDLVIAVGSTLSVYPAANIPVQAIRAGARFVILNQGATDLDDLADVVVAGDAGDLLPRLVAAVS